MNDLHREAAKTHNWRQIQPTSLKAVRQMLVAKHGGSLTAAASKLDLRFQRLSATLGGREQIVWIIEAIQNDLELSDEQVLNLWPLLKEWPKESRRAG
jgi:hypothetical protein